MKLQLRAYSMVGQPLDVLEEARNISFNSSALTFDMPKTAQGIEYFDAPIAVGVEIEALAGGTYGPLQYTANGEVDTRFIWRSSAQSLTQPTGIWSFTCPSIAAVAFERMPILPQLGHTVSYGADATPYTIIANRVAEAKTRGDDYGITVVDGGGWTDPNVATSLAFDQFSTLDAFYNALKDGTHAELFWVGSTLYVMAPGTMTIDRTGPVAFQIEDFSDIPQKIDRSNLADTILGLGDNGISDLYPPEAPGLVITVQFSGITDQATLHEAVLAEWNSRQTPAREITASLALSSNGPDGNPLLTPYRDYHRGSLVTFPTKDGDTEPIKVADITLTRDTEEDFGGSIVLDTKLKPTDLKIIELGKLGVGGVTAVSGNGSVLPKPQSDTGWQSLTPHGADWKTTSYNGHRDLSIRRVGNVVYVEGSAWRTPNDVVGSAINSPAVDVQFRPVGRSRVALNWAQEGKANVGGSSTDVYMDSSGVIRIDFPTTGPIYLYINACYLAE